MISVFSGPYHRSWGRTGIGKEASGWDEKEVSEETLSVQGRWRLSQTLDTPIADQLLWPLPQQMRCGYCLKFEHYKCDCRMANKVCLACGSDGHLIRNCSFIRMGNTTPIQLTLPVPPVRRDSGPIERKTPFPSPQYVFNQAQRRPRGRADGRRQKHIIWPPKITKVSDEVETGSGALYLEQGPLKVTPVTIIPIFSCLELINFSLSYPFYHDISINPIFPCSSSPYQNFEDEIFVRWMECNTQFLKYILIYVF